MTVDEYPMLARCLAFAKTQLATGGVRRVWLRDDLMRELDIDYCVWSFANGHAAVRGLGQDLCVLNTRFQARSEKPA
jgi:hypothetical protein